MNYSAVSFKNVKVASCANLGLQKLLWMQFPFLSTLQQLIRTAPQGSQMAERTSSPSQIYCKAARSLALEMH